MYSYDKSSLYLRAQLMKMIAVRDKLRNSVASADLHDAATFTVSSREFMILYSTDPTEGFLTKQGISQIKSALARSIFPEQLRELYATDTQRRDALKADARKLYQELIVQMASGTVRNERIEKLTEQLIAKLSAHKGKIQYGYLQAPVRAMVDEIVDELARDARVAEAYRLWYDIRTDIVSTYQDEMPELPPLSRQKEFKPIRNMVVTEAAKLLGHEFTFEEAPSDEHKVPECGRAPWYEGLSPQDAA